ncbi:MAG TPA: hypothetical protein DD740_10900 [Chryseobacterium sp.]|nr:hypothetical protein [Chryseobacterium sp.]
MKTKFNKLLIILFLFILELSSAQSKFDSGYSAGYSAGYCQDKELGCVSPVAPIAPVPNASENLDSYKDGYNRGFKAGFTGINQDTRSRYKTSKPTFFDNSSDLKSTNQILMLALKKKREIENKVTQAFQEAHNDIESYKDNESEYIKNLKIIYLTKIEKLANNSGQILTDTKGDYQHLIKLLQKIYDEFYEEIEKSK